MVRKQHVGKYVGGPLDGQDATSATGRWPTYRDDDGGPCSASKGDAEVIRRGNSGKPIRRFYVHQEWPRTVVIDGNAVIVVEHTYVHGTIWKSWNAERLGIEVGEGK